MGGRVCPLRVLAPEKSRKHIDARLPAAPTSLGKVDERKGTSSFIASAGSRSRQRSSGTLEARERTPCPRQSQNLRVEPDLSPNTPASGSCLRCIAQMGAVSRNRGFSGDSGHCRRNQALASPEILSRHSDDRAPQRGVGAQGRPRSPAGLAGYVRRPRRAA
jgi:hypothetical protein